MLWNVQSPPRPNASCTPATSQPSQPGAAPGGPAVLEAALAQPWPSAPGYPSLEPNAVHVWAIPLAAPPATCAALEVVLSPDERRRAARFRFDQHRNRFIVGRGRLRMILGRYLNFEPAAIEFDYSERGKPFLASRLGRSGLEFNFSNSGLLALLAVTRDQAVGVDLEAVRPIQDVDGLVTRFFSPRENAIFHTISEEHKPAAFFNLWTRKEAWLKATGQGIGHALNQVEVSFLNGDEAKFLGLPSGFSLSAWHLRSMTPAPGLVAALARAGELPTLQCWSCLGQGP
jgi:4'-phosphopantetheinyl transferase